MLARSATEVRPQPSFAACAASSAISMSLASDRAIWQITLPFTGRRIVEIAPGIRGDELAANEIVIPFTERRRHVGCVENLCVGHVISSRSLALFVGCEDWEECSACGGPAVSQRQSGGMRDVSQE
jgi:hypothetical protein